MSRVTRSDDLATLTRALTGHADSVYSKAAPSRPHIMYSSPTCMTVAVVNLKPLCPGHILVFSQRGTGRLSDLTPEEHLDLWKTVRDVQKILKAHLKPNAFTMSVSDGYDAGVTVEGHVHVHVVPTD